MSGKVMGGQVDAIAAGGGASGGKVAEGSETGVSSFDVALPAGYTSYRLEFTISNASATSQIEIVVTDDGFATVEAGAADYKWTSAKYQGSFVGVKSSGDDSIQTLGGVAAYNGKWVVDIISARESGELTGFQLFGNYNNAGLATAQVVGEYQVASILNGLRLFAAAGTFDVSWRLYAQ